MNVTIDPASIKCSKCELIIKYGEACYQLRIGAMDIEDDFQPDEDVEYYHVDCPKTECKHETPTVPTRHEVVSSNVYKNDVVENSNQYYHTHQIRQTWKPTDYAELFLTVEFINKTDIHDNWEDKFAFVKCKACGVIQSV